MSLGTASCNASHACRGRSQAVTPGFAAAAVFALVLAAACVRPGHAAVTSSERAALVDLYLATNGNNWINKTGWAGYANPANDPCASPQAWHGVLCAPGSDVVA
jgi:hypothetical protein